MINFDNIALDYEPYPIGVTRPAFDPEFYQDLVSSFPPIDMFKYKESKGDKFSLSQVNHGKRYKKFINESPPWRRFHDFVHSGSFISNIYDMLRSHNIDLGPAEESFQDKLSKRVWAWKRGVPLPQFPKFKARFEFSAMPITGGNILPHTDSIRKSVTLVVPILDQDEWDESWGGGTSIVRPKDPTRLFNRTNAYMDFDEVETVKTFPFIPNQCLIFVKTYNSWHAVLPMTGSDKSILRRTLTINIDRS